MTSTQTLSVPKTSPISLRNVSCSASSGRFGYMTRKYPRDRRNTLPAKRTILLKLFIKRLAIGCHRSPDCGSGCYRIGTQEGMGRQASRDVRLGMVGMRDRVFRTSVTLYHLRIDRFIAPSLHANTPDPIIPETLSSTSSVVRPSKWIHISQYLLHGSTHRMLQSWRCHRRL